MVKMYPFAFPPYKLPVSHNRAFTYPLTLSQPNAEPRRDFGCAAMLARES